MRRNNKWIAYVGPFSFPWGQPGSRRVGGMARSLADAGYDVVVGSGAAEPAAPLHLGEGEYPGSVSYLGLGEAPPPGTRLPAKLLQLFVNWGKKTVAWLDRQPVKPSCVILYGGSAQYMFRLLPWCRRNGVPLVVDVVEWYNPHQLSGGYFGPFHVSAKIALRYQYAKSAGVIGISSCLTEHYRKKGCEVVRIPPTIDVSGVTLVPRREKGDPSLLTLVYAGTPAKKDLLGNVIRGISMVDPAGKRVRLVVLGPAPEQVKLLLNGENLPPFVEVLGRVPQAEVSGIIQQADFSVLLREQELFAQAGFPTKIVESMSNGTPVIANLTSDIGMYLHDGAEGLISPDHSAAAFAETLQRALLLSPETREGMRHATRRQAELSFDFRNFAEPLQDFLKRVLAKG